jgi:hypothetical protein
MALQTPSASLRTGETDLAKIKDVVTAGIGYAAYTGMTGRRDIAR